VPYRSPPTCHVERVRGSIATKNESKHPDNSNRNHAAPSHLSWLKVLGFATHCLCPSAIDPTPLDALLKTKAQPQFDSPVDRAVEAFFCVFLRSNRAQLQSSFSVFTVRSAEGRKFQEAARRNNCRASTCHPERAAAFAAEPNWRSSSYSVPALASS